MRTDKYRVFAATIVATTVSLIGMNEAALAKPAQCYTTDDGKYSCTFTSTDKKGSFDISAPGKPTFSLLVDAPGTAYGYADFGTGRNVSLPGMYIRRNDDPACWSNNETNAKICAW